MQLETISLPFEVRSVKENTEQTRGYIEGYASVFGVIDSYNTIFERGCFDKSLKDYGMPAFLLHHSGTNPAGITLEAREDNTGLYVKGEMNLEVQEVKEAYALAKQGALKGISVGFVPRKWEDNKEYIRTFKEVDLMEYSLVTFPANPLAKVKAVRSDLPKTTREFEAFLREVGFARNDAKRIASTGFSKQELDKREADLTDVCTKLENLINQFKGK